MYDQMALDVFGRDAYRICINEFATEDDLRVHETVAVAYAFAHSSILNVPQSKDGIINILENVLNLPYDLLLNSPPGDISTPWGLAKRAVEDIVEFAESDGWNSDGSLTNTYNKQPYSDIPYYKDDNGNVYESYDTKKQKTGGAVKIMAGTCKKTPNPWYW